MRRIEKLRAKTFDPAIYGNEFYYVFYKAYEAQEGFAACVTQTANPPQFELEIFV